MPRPRKTAGWPRAVLDEIGLIPGKPASEYDAEQLAYFRRLGIGDPAAVRLRTGPAPTGREAVAWHVTALALSRPRWSRRILTEDDLESARYRSRADAYAIAARVLHLREPRLDNARREVRRLIAEAIGSKTIRLVEGAWRRRMADRS